MIAEPLRRAASASRARSRLRQTDMGQVVCQELPRVLTQLAEMTSHMGSISLTMQISKVDF
jgi:hypothetical protein